MLPPKPTSLAPFWAWHRRTTSTGLTVLDGYLPVEYDTVPGLPEDGFLLLVHRGAVFVRAGLRP